MGRGFEVPRRAKRENPGGIGRGRDSKRGGEPGGRFGSSVCDANSDSWDDLKLVESFCMGSDSESLSVPLLTIPDSV